MSRQPTRTGGGAAPEAPRLVVVGSGIAGLYAALLAVEAGLDTVLLSKGALADSNTSYAQGGISAVLDQPAPGDTVAAHIEDTLRAGAGLCNAEAVRIMCTEARQDIAGLRRFGVPFDTGPGGETALGLEAAHSAPRILHAGGDATGAGIASALIARLLEASSRKQLRVIARAHVTALTTDGGRVTGISYLVDGRRSSLEADAVLLATGGAGQLFAQTTNPAVATADGLALAWRAGAEVADCEFFQFHPTALAFAAGEAAETSAAEHAPLLISEAVRGEGAILVDTNGARFLTGYHPDGELAPRDVVSRSIALHLATLGNPTGHVYLDARVIERARGAGFLERRFPTLSRRTQEAGIDWTRQPVPVAPAAHYWMGGVSTDLHGRTSLPGLYAAGEVACTGVHGANRLASNSLLEGLVFARRAVADVLRSAGTPTRPAAGARTGRLSGWTGGATPGPGLLETSSAFPAAFSRDALRSLMTSKAGVIRDGAALREAAAILQGWAAEVRPDLVPQSDVSRVHEDANLLLAAQLLVAAAQKRRTGAGAHFRSDSPPWPPAVGTSDQPYITSRKASLPR